MKDECCHQHPDNGALALQTEAQRAETDLRAVNVALLEALESMLNVEGAARIGAESGALRGLDWKYHFNKAREAIKAAKS